MYTFGEMSICCLFLNWICFYYLRCFLTIVFLYPLSSINYFIYLLFFYVSSMLLAFLRYLLCFKILLSVWSITYDRRTTYARESFFYSTCFLRLPHIFFKANVRLRLLATLTDNVLLEGKCKSLGSMLCSSFEFRGSGLVRGGKPP